MNTDHIFKKYDTVWRPLAFGGLSFELLQLRNFEKTVDDVIEKLAAAGKKDIVPEDCPYFGQVWASARHLADLMCTEPVEGKTLLEIGCGLAVPSMVAAKRGATCWVMDLHEDVPAFVTENCRANHLDDRLHLIRGNWRDHEFEQRFELIIGSDILYENDHPKDVCAFLKRTLVPGGRLLIVDPCRWHHRDFVSLLVSEGFSLDEQYSPSEEDGKPVKLFTLRGVWKG